MKNLFVNARSAADIDRSVSKILADLKSVEPPLELALVRELLDLDLGFFTSESEGFLQTSVHRIKVAGLQILQRPAILLDAIRKADISALWVPDRKRILIDDSKPKIKHRWFEAHEIGHSMIPWHEAVLHGDTSVTITPACQAEVEAEANYAAGQLLFMRERFTSEAFDSTMSLSHVRALSKTFGNTMTSTLWRFVEGVPTGVPVVGVVGAHPKEMWFGPNPALHCRYVIQSPRFAQQFPTVTELELLNKICKYCAWRQGGPLGEEDVVLTDVRGEEHVFHFESFYNRHDVLTLGIWQKAHVAAA